MVVSTSTRYKVIYYAGRVLIESGMKISSALETLRALKNTASNKLSERKWRWIAGSSMATTLLLIAYSQYQKTYPSLHLRNILSLMQRHSLKKQLEESTKAE